MKTVIIYALLHLNYDLVHAQGLLKSLFSEKQSLEFVKNQPLDKPMTELNKKYRDGFRTIPCLPWIRERSKEKNIKCMELPLNSRVYRDDLLAVVQDGKVVLYGRGLGGNHNAVMVNAPTPEEEFGSSAPNVIYEVSPERGVQSFLLLWDIKSGYSRASITCSLKKYAGKTVVGPLRKCAMHMMIISRMQDYLKEESAVKQDKNLKISTEKY